MLFDLDLVESVLADTLHLYLVLHAIIIALAALIANDTFHVREIVQSWMRRHSSMVVK